MITTDGDSWPRRQTALNVDARWEVKDVDRRRATVGEDMLASKGLNRREIHTVGKFLVADSRTSPRY